MLYENESEKLQPYSWPELITRPQRQLLVPELLFTTGVTTLIAQSGEGKTTLANSLGLTVATGSVWGGQTIKLRPLVWAAGEGQDDMRPMYKAWMQAHPNAPQPKGFWLDDAVDFSNDRKTTQFIELLNDMNMPEAVIVPDALADMIGALDENSSKDINQVYRNVWRVIKANRSCFLIPHHSGWDEKRERGSTAIRAKSDIVIQITRFDPIANIITLKHHKRRGGRKLKEFSFEMKLITLNPYSQPVPIITGTMLETSTTQHTNVDEQNLVSMIMVLRTLLGNKVTSGHWQKQMETYGGTGWSKPSFKRRLKILKTKAWVRIIGDPQITLDRAPEGALFEATEIAPGHEQPETNTTQAVKNNQAISSENRSLPNRAQPPFIGGADASEPGWKAEEDQTEGSNQAHEPSEPSSSRSGNGSDNPVVTNGVEAAAERTKELLERLKRKPSAA